MTLLNIHRICLLVSSLGLVYQFFIFDRFKMGITVILIGIIWTVGQKRGWQWVSYPALTLYTVASVQLLFLEISPHWGLLIFSLVLCAWDLEHFVRRLKQKQEIRRQVELEKRHLWRLMVVVVLGLMVGELIFTTKFEMNLVWMAILAIAAAMGIYFFLTSTRSE